jgi:hypothetical protein
MAECRVLPKNSDWRVRVRRQLQQQTFAFSEQEHCVTLLRDNLVVA